MVSSTRSSAPIGGMSIATLTATTGRPMLRAAATGTSASTPPSTSRRPSTSTAGTTPGIALDALRIVRRSPPDSLTSVPVSKSVATAMNGRGSCSAVISGIRNSSACISSTPSRMVERLTATATTTWLRIRRAACSSGFSRLRSRGGRRSGRTVGTSLRSNASRHFSIAAAAEP